MKNYGTTPDGRVLTTQRAVILEYLQSQPGRRITQWEAIKEFGFTRLSAIIFQIEDIYRIEVKRERKEVTTRYGAKTWVTAYWIDKE